MNKKLLLITFVIILLFMISSCTIRPKGGSLLFPCKGGCTVTYTYQCGFGSFVVDIPGSCSGRTTDPYSCGCSANQPNPPLGCYFESTYISSACSRFVK